MGLVPFVLGGASIPTGTVTLSAIRDQVRQRADMVNSQFVTDDELDTYINGSYFELYDLLVQKYGDNYFVAAAYEITTDGSETYDLPDDFYKLLGVDLQTSDSADSRITLKPFNFAERNRYGTNVQSILGEVNFRYRLNGNSLWLTPTPDSGQTIILWYVPVMTRLEDDDDTMNGVSGWEEYVVVDAVIKAKTKEESDVSVELAQKAALVARIESAAENRDAGSPATVTDSRANDFWWPDGSN